MSGFLFGLRYGTLTAAEEMLHDAVAKRYGIAFHYGDFPGEGWKSWFAGPNLGDPFDGQLAREVAAVLNGKA